MIELKIFLELLIQLSNIAIKYKAEDHFKALIGVK